MTPFNVDAALDMARRARVDRLDAQLLLGHLLGLTRAGLAAHGDTALDAAQAAAYRSMLARRGAGEPLAYVIGQTRFCGLLLEVTPAVLIPRPETEGLVQWALELAAEVPPGAIVDLGTGSGAIALALASGLAPSRPKIEPAPIASTAAVLPPRQVCASDVSAAALAVARTNAARHALSVDWAQGDWWCAWPARRFVLAVANPPYIDAADPHLAALSHEPLQALTPGADGLAAARAIVEGAATALRSGAWLLLEHGHDQAEGVRTLLEANGFGPAETRRDLAGLPRCTGAEWRGIE